MNDRMDSFLIKNTTREERERIVAESIGNISGSCDGCAAGVSGIYQDFHPLERAHGARTEKSATLLYLFQRMALTIYQEHPSKLSFY